MKRNIKNFYRDLPLPKPERVLPPDALPGKPSALKRYRSYLLGGAAAAAAVILCAVAAIRFLPSRGQDGNEYLPHLQPVESYLTQETKWSYPETKLPAESEKTDNDRMEDQTPADVAAATDFRLLHDKESGKFYFSFDGKMQEAGSGEVFFFMFLWTFDSESRFGSDAVLEPGVLILSSEELMVQFYHPATGEVRVLARESDFSFSHSSIDGRFSPLFVKQGEQYLIIDQPIWMNRLAFEDTIAVIEPDENGWPIVNTDRSTWSFLKIEPETQPETEPETKAPETKAPETKAPETKAPETKAPETTRNMDILEP